MILTQSNNHRAFTRWQWHVVPLTSACPVSRNPQDGSVLFVLYSPASLFIEVYSLRAEILSYRGGKGDIRSMEDMLQQIATDCAKAIDVPVTLGAFVRLQYEDCAVHICTGTPHE